MTRRTTLPQVAFALGLLLWFSTTQVACGTVGYTFSEMPTTEDAGDSSGGGSTTGAPLDCKTDTYDNYAKAFVAKSCGQSCHPGLKPPDLTSQKAFVDNKATVLDQISQKKMPLGSPMNDADAARFTNWVNCGAL